MGRMVLHTASRCRQGEHMKSSSVSGADCLEREPGGQGAHAGLLTAVRVCGATPGHDP